MLRSKPTILQAVLVPFVFVDETSILARLDALDLCRSKASLVSYPIKERVE